MVDKDTDLGRFLKEAREGVVTKLSDEQKLVAAMIALNVPPAQIAEYYAAVARDAILPIALVESAKQAVLETISERLYPEELLSVIQKFVRDCLSTPEISDEIILSGLSELIVVLRKRGFATTGDLEVLGIRTKSTYEKTGVFNASAALQFIVSARQEQQEQADQQEHQLPLDLSDKSTSE